MGIAHRQALRSQLLNNSHNIGSCFGHFNLPVTDSAKSSIILPTESCHEITNCYSGQGGYQDDALVSIQHFFKLLFYEIACFSQSNIFAPMKTCDEKITHKSYGAFDRRNSEESSERECRLSIGTYAIQIAARAILRNGSCLFVCCCLR